MQSLVAAEGNSQNAIILLKNSRGGRGPPAHLSSGGDCGPQGGSGEALAGECGCHFAGLCDNPFETIRFGSDEFGFDERPARTRLYQVFASEL